MSPAERRDLMVNVFDRMLAQMTVNDRSAFMEHVVDHFLDSLSNEERVSVVRELVPQLMSQLLKSGGMSVDDFLWTAMGSLGALEKEHKDGGADGQDGAPSPGT